MALRKTLHEQSSHWLGGDKAWLWYKGGVVYT